MALLMALAGLGLVAAEPAALGVVNSTLRGNEPRHLASCGVAGAVDCGVCKCTDRMACQWCDGNGGPASIGSSGSSNSAAPASTHTSGSCPSNLVSCGVCTCTTRSACQYCDGYGGPARISVSASHRVCVPLAALLALPLASRDSRAQKLPGNEAPTLPQYKVKFIGNTAQNEGGYTTYIIQVTHVDGSSWTLQRRYRALRELHDELKLRYGETLPHFPAKRFFGNNDPTFIAARQAAHGFELRGSGFTVFSL
ncbi:KIF16B [Symbiodinium sp. CCMP2592]|nr:KIF16B [Symbiodinium sp. CCMP2592]